MVLRRLSSALLFYTFVYMNRLNLVPPPMAGAVSVTNETDYRALLEIKKAIWTDPFGAFNSWNASIHFCNWAGVTCSLRHQRVTVLNMSSLQLVGTMSPHIGNLSFLRMIYLKGNNFQGNIPEEIGRLFRLENLFLSNNSFQGHLPTNLTRCSNLRFIHLRGNNLEGNIPPDLSSLSQLRSLQVSINHFTGTIPPSLGNISSLRWLFISRNHLEGSIPAELGRIRLEMLQLSFNRLSGEIPSSLYNITSISLFSVALNQLRGQLPSDIGLTLPKLEGFCAGGNQLSGPIPSSLANASALTRIDISLNAITGPLPLNLGNLKRLQFINLGGNPLGTGKGDVDFIFSLTNCSSLRRLWLLDDQLKGVLPGSIANLSSNLLSFRLDGNYLSGNIPQGIENLVNLELLVLDFNEITGSIPDTIGHLSRLQVFSMADNKFSGKIPSSIGNMTLLSRLILEANMLEQAIPSSLGNCTVLQELILSTNRLVGKIPEGVIGLSSLSLGLGLARNNLTGPLPPEVGNLKNLILLDISENKLSGEIPNTIGSCVQLESLNLAGNFFLGKIPPSFENLKSIQDLNLSRNNLSGQIPSFLGELDYALYINLSFNNFEGEVPTVGVFTNTSAFSVTGNTKLCGGVRSINLPACPTKASKNHGKRRVIIVALVASAAAVVCLSACFYAIFYRTRRSKKETCSASPLEEQYLKLSYAQLLEATDGFSSANLVGEGNIGSVYKGILKITNNEKTIAVKVLKLQKPGAERSFLTECEALRNMRHRNLVKIITSCSSIDFKGNEFKALVFEFLANGNLDSWLHPSHTDFNEGANNLTFIQRLNIAIDVAAALDYLHHHCQPIVVHCDLKPSNVLLDDDLVGHVGDFGLARILLATTDEKADIQTSLAGIRGTVGYIPPEYGMWEEISPEGDVYSYGILILEMFTGRRPTDSMFTDNNSLHNYVKMALPDQLKTIIDPSLMTNQTRLREGDIYAVQELLASILRIGVICSSEMPRERKNIKDALRELHLIKDRFLALGTRGQRGSMA
ncbi:hypothetical protein SLE2022_224470 [Rubroshorea leprosula]